MNKFTAVAASALALFSGAALAEQGSSELNKVVHPTSAPDDQTSADRNMVPSDLTSLNGAGGNNAISRPTSTAQHQDSAGKYIALTELTSRNS